MKAKIFKYIYAMLCLMPAIAVGVTCAYTIQNQNAYESYTSEFDVSSTVITNIYTPTSNELIELHYFNNSGTSDLQIGNFTEFDDSLNEIWGFPSGTIPSYFQILSNGNMNYLYGGAWYNKTGYWGTQITSFHFKLNGTQQLNLNNTNVKGYLLQYRNVNTLDNVFYYSVDKVSNQPVFSWVKNNFLYDGMNQFVGIFGGADTNISFYLTWVLTISLCYLGFETLMLFINIARNLIHGLTNKEF